MNNLLPGLAQRLAALTRESIQVSPPVSPVGDQLPEFQPGERYSARILQNLADGRTRAQVAGQTVTLQLPQGAREGSTVNLTHVGRSAQTLIATLANDDAPARAPADNVRLSASARTISTLLDGPEPPPARLNAGQALIDPTLLRASANMTDTAASPLLAGRLAQAIGQSGLFYESHQAQWVSGERTIESTSAEPQRAFDPPGTKAATAPDPRTALLQTARDTDDPAAARGDLPVRERAETVKGDTPPGELRPLVQNQLLGLSQHALTWEGLAWPGQMMKIEIDDPRDDPHGEQHDADPADDVPWTSRLRIVLPGLGDIETSLTLRRSQGLALTFTTDGDARARLGAALEELQTRISDAGLRLGAVTFTEPAPAAEHRDSANDEAVTAP